MNTYLYNRDVIKENHSSIFARLFDSFFKKLLEASTGATLKSLSRTQRPSDALLTKLTQPSSDCSNKKNS